MWRRLAGTSRAPKPIRPTARYARVAASVQPVKLGTGAAAGSAVAGSAVAGSVAAGLGLGSVPKPDGPPTGSGLTVKGPAYAAAGAHGVITEASASSQSTPEAAPSQSASTELNSQSPIGPDAFRQALSPTHEPAPTAPAALRQASPPLHEFSPIGPDELGQAEGPLHEPPSTCAV